MCTFVHTSAKGAVCMWVWVCACPCTHVHVCQSVCVECARVCLGVSICAPACVWVCVDVSLYIDCVCVFVSKRECAGLRPGASVCKRTDTRRYVVRTQQETPDDAVAVLQPNVRMAPSQLTKQLRAHYRPPPLSSRTSPLDRQITPRLTLPLALSDLAAAPAT